MEGKHTVQDAAQLLKDMQITDKDQQFQDIIDGTPNMILSYL
jgi:hypothetical protein